MRGFNMRQSLMATVIAIMSTAAFSAASHAAELKALVGGNVVDVETGKTIKNATVLIEDERIVKIGARDDVAIPGDAEVVEVTGKYLTPGLINMHTHFTLVLPGTQAMALQNETEAEMAYRAAENARKSLLAGTTTVRTPGEDKHVSLALNKAIQKGYAVGPRIFSAGIPVTPTGGHSGDLVLNGVDGPTEIAKHVRRQILAGATWIKLMSTRGLADPHGAIASSDLTVEEMSKAVEIAHGHGAKVTAHCSNKTAALQALEAGVDSFEHGYFFDEETYKAMKKADAWYIPTIVVSQKGAMEFFEKIGSPKWYLDRAAKVGEQHWKSLQMAIKMNVNIAMGSDQFPYEPNEGTVASIRETELYVEAGMTPAQALRTATLNPARLLGADKDVGSLRAGKYADILVLEDNPLEDIRALRTLGMVMKGGEVVRNDWAQ